MVSSIRNLDQEVIAELSMVDIVYAILKEGNKEPKSFHDLFQEVAQLKGITVEDKINAMSQLYTEINIDGRFHGLGDNVWGLRSWYSFEQAEEIVITELKKRSKKKKKYADDDEEYDYDYDEETYDDDLDEDLDDDDEDVEDDLDDDDDEDLDDIDDDFDDEDDIDGELDEDLEDIDELDESDDLDEDFDDLDEDER